MEWYIKKGVALDLKHFLLRAQDTDDWNEHETSKDHFINLLIQKIESVDFSKVKEDVVKFITDASASDIWNADYFKALCEKMKVRE